MEQAEYSGGAPPKRVVQGLLQSPTQDRLGPEAQEVMHDLLPNSPKGAPEDSGAQRGVNTRSTAEGSSDLRKQF